MKLFPLSTMRLFAPRDIAVYPNIAAYLQRIGSRDAFQRARAKADLGFAMPFTLLGSKPFTPVSQKCYTL